MPTATTHSDAAIFHFVPSSADTFQELETLNRQLKVAPSHTGAKHSLFNSPGFTNFIDEWSQCDICFTNFGDILEYLESSITTKKAISDFPARGPGVYTIS